MPETASHCSICHACNVHLQPSYSCSQIKPEELAALPFTAEAAETAAELAAVINGAVAPTLGARRTLLGLLAAVRRIRYGGEAGDLGASHAETYGEPPDLRAELSREWGAVAGGDGSRHGGSAGAASGVCGAAGGTRNAAGGAAGALDDAFGGVAHDAAGSPSDAFGGVGRDAEGAAHGTFGAPGLEAYVMDSDAFGGVAYAGASGAGDGAGGSYDPYER